MWNIDDSWFANCGEHPWWFDDFGWFDCPICFCCDDRWGATPGFTRMPRSWVDAGALLRHGRGLKPTRRSKTSPSTPSVPRDTKAGDGNVAESVWKHERERREFMIPWNMIGNYQFMVSWNCTPSSLSLIITSGRYGMFDDFNSLSTWHDKHIYQLQA